MNGNTVSGHIRSVDYLRNARLRSFKNISKTFFIVFLFDFSQAKEEVHYAPHTTYLTYP